MNFREDVEAKKLVSFKGNGGKNHNLHLFNS